MNKPWFGKKLLGWGWGLPVRWQGWVVLALYLLALRFFYFIANTQTIFFIIVIFTSILFFAVVWVTSGKPQWGTWWDRKKRT